MMNGLRDNERRKLAIWPGLIAAWMIYAATEKKDYHNYNVLVDAIDECFSGIPKNKAARLKERTKDDVNAIFSTFDKQNLLLILMTIIFTMNRLADTGRLVIKDGSKLDKGHSYIMAELDKMVTERHIAEYESAAEKQSERLWDKLFSLKLL